LAGVPAIATRNGIALRPSADDDLGIGGNVATAAAAIAANAASIAASPFSGALRHGGASINTRQIKTFSLIWKRKLKLMSM
jgi:hypothetical protein